MWYNTKKECYIENDYQLRDIFYELANDNLEYFNLDDFIDACYPERIEMFGVSFYPHFIIKECDPDLYSQIFEKLIDDWVEEALYQLDRYIFDEGDTIEGTLELGFEELKDIVWKEKGENE